MITRKELIEFIMTHWNNESYDENECHGCDRHVEGTYGIRANSSHLDLHDADCFIARLIREETK